MTTLVAFAVCSCRASSSVSSAHDADGVAAVHRYVTANKRWRARDYRVGAPQRERGLLVYEVMYLPDSRPPVQPGGGESFWAYYDANRKKIVEVLYGQ